MCAWRTGATFRSTANDLEDMAGELAGVGNTAIAAIWPFGFEWLESEVPLFNAKRLDHDIACSFMAELDR